MISNPCYVCLLNLAEFLPDNSAVVEQQRGSMFKVQNCRPVNLHSLVHPWSTAGIRKCIQPKWLPCT